MKLLRYFAAVALIVAAHSTASSSAFAADPVFPPGARVGMTPLVGLNKAKAFIGFETEDQGVKVLVTDLPAEAYGEVANAFKANPGGTGGIKPESIETSAGLAYNTAETRKDCAHSRARLLPRRKRQGRRHQRAPLFDDPARPHFLRLCRCAGARKRFQDLYRRRYPPDVRFRRDPHRGADRRAARADAIQGQR